MGERLDLRHALVHSILPEVRSHDLHGLLGLGLEPGQRHHQRVHVAEVDHRERLGLQERLVDARCQPGILLDQRLPDADEMHDREQAGLLVVGLLGLARIGEQSRNMRLAVEERRRRARREQRVELAVAQHLDQRLPGLERLEVEAGDVLERRTLAAAGLLLPAVAPMDLVRLHAVLVLHHPAHPDHRGDLIFRQADALAAQVCRRADAGAGADIDAGVAEDARHEGRDADVRRRTGRHRAQVARERDLGDVELLELEGAVEDLLRVERQIGDRAAVHLDATVPDRGGAVVIAACDRDWHLDHAIFPRPRYERRGSYWLPYWLKSLLRGGRAHAGCSPGQARSARAGTHATPCTPGYMGPGSVRHSASKTRVDALTARRPGRRSHALVGGPLGG